MKKTKCMFMLTKNIFMQGICKIILVLCIGALIPPQVSAAHKSLKFVFFNNATLDDDWWHKASQTMKAACADLGIALDIYYADRNQFLMVRQFQNLLKTDPDINGVIFANMKQNMIQMLKTAETAHIPAFIFNAGLTKEKIKKYGGPRQYFNYWIGQILPDDAQAGYDLAVNLFAQAKKAGLTDHQGKIQVIGLGGTVSDIAAIEREKGLRSALKESPQVILKQIVPAAWTRERGQAVFLGLKSRYPETTVVWAANDPMGLGAIDGIKQLKLKPGKDILVGSIDWVPEALASIQKGDLSISIGGHFLETAWSVVLLYDYLNGNDFSNESVNFRSTMEILTRQNMNRYIPILKDMHWERVDFKRFSKTFTPSVKSYHFTMDAIIRQYPQ